MSERFVQVVVKTEDTGTLTINRPDPSVLHYLRQASDCLYQVREKLKTLGEPWPERLEDARKAIGEEALEREGTR